MIVSLIVSSLCLAAELGQPVVYAGNEELRGYLLEAGEKSPTLQARNDEWRAALERIPQATALDDPMFTLGYFLRSELNDYRVMVAQKLPWFGTLKAQGEKAALEAEAALAVLADERNRCYAEVKKAYYEYAFLGESIVVVESQLEILKYMEDIVRYKYEVGMANEDELLRISIERTKVNDRLDRYADLKPALLARLNQAMGVETVTERPWPQESPFPADLPEDEVLHASLRSANPDLKRLEFLIESRAKQTELARKKGYPDFTLSLEYMTVGSPSLNRPDRPYPASLNALNRTANVLGGTMPFNATTAALDLYTLGTTKEPISYPDDFEDNLSISLSVNLPIWNKKNKARIAEAKLMEKSVEHMKRARTLQLEEACEMMVYSVKDGKRRYRLYEQSLLPQARRSYESLQAQYSIASFGTGFLDVLDSVQTLLAFELEQVVAKRDWQVAAADLEYVIGESWATDEVTTVEAVEVAQ